MTLHVEKVTWRVEEQAILRDVAVDVAAGELVGVLGPNGSGKSSLLRCIYRALKPDAGYIALDGDNVWDLDAKEAARRTATVLQETPGEFEFVVWEMVLMGRAPHKRMFARENAEDHDLVESALGQVGMLPFAERSFATLSGGEKQRVLIARALAQQARFLILDEPTNHLDVRYQLEILDLVRGLQVTTFTALHDLNLAATYCDRLYIMSEGEIVAAGTPEDVFQPALLRKVFGVEAEVQVHPRTGKLHIVFLPAHAAAPSATASNEAPASAVLVGES
ncbi:MAG: ABC transporter ATP-binding protein [Chloroflexota bacterium]|nr:ABC transporter ATP-binding protein [Chloroflexota bacterium]MDE2840884.1 ABC transporter ATP-binding protein [Chloroflexota bacterium]